MGHNSMGTPYLGQTVDHAGNKEDFNFETLNASVQASINAKKQENAQMARTIMSLQSSVEHLSRRCEMHEKALDRERSERVEAVEEIKNLLSRELHALGLSISKAKCDQEQRESA